MPNIFIKMCGVSCVLKINLVVVPLLLTACSHNDGPLVQDVYNNQYDCARDWNNETCKQENSSSGHGSSYVGSRYLGPAYYQNNREVSFHGNTLHPYSNLSVGRPIISSTAKSASSSSPIRGGLVVVVSLSAAKSLGIHLI